MMLEPVEGNQPTWMIEKQASKEKNNRYLDRT